MLSEIEKFMLGKFNLFTEILPAKHDRIHEGAMVAKLLHDPANRFSLQQLQEAVHKLVHESKHYQVIDR